MKRSLMLVLTVLITAGCSNRSDQPESPATTPAASAEPEIPYGNNPAAGKYLQVDDAKIYYEVYGQGPPLLLLHGDFYGSIGEFELYYPMLAKNFTVIAVGRRGHAQSGMGKQPFTVKLFADDALAVLKNEKFDKATVVGFSAGAITSYYLAAHHPDVVTRVVALAGGINNRDQTPETKAEILNATFSDVERDAAEFVQERRKRMPEPHRFEELHDRLKKMWVLDVLTEDEKAKTISCPVLIVVGDRDGYSSVAKTNEIYKTIPGSQLAVIPDCDHVGLILRPNMFESMVMPFLLAK